MAAQLVASRVVLSSTELVILILYVMLIITAHIRIIWAVHYKILVYVDTNGDTCVLRQDVTGCEYIFSVVLLSISYH
jgi:hypothetical protein